MEIEGARFAQEFHIGFGRELVSLLAVARMAAGDKIFPGGGTTAGAGNHVVERQFTRRQHFAAVLAGIAVAQQDVLPRQSPALVRNTTVFEKTDHRGNSHGKARSVQEMTVLFLGHRDALEHKHNGATRSAHVDRLVGGVEHEHGRVQRVAVAVLMSAH